MSYLILSLLCDCFFFLNQFFKRNVRNVRKFPIFTTNFLVFKQLYNADDICSICYEKYTDMALVSQILKCGHIYHNNCLDDWFNIKIKCPLCNCHP